MDDSIKQEEQERNELPGSALIPSELHILVTEADINGYEISKMSDFMGLYAQYLTRSLAESSFVEVVSSVPIADESVPKSVEIESDSSGYSLVDYR